MSWSDKISLALICFTAAFSGGAIGAIIGQMGVWLGFFRRAIRTGKKQF